MINLNRKTITKTFEKTNVIKNGEHFAKKRKLVWLLFGIASLVLIAVYDFSFFVQLGDKTLSADEVSALVLQNVTFAGFGIFSIIFSQVKKYDYLLLGCKSIRWNENKPLRVSRRNKRKAKKNNKVNYVRNTSSFNMDELYNLLCKHDVVKYSWIVETDIVPVSSNANYLNHTTSFEASDYDPDDHHFDKEFTDEEFDDLMD